MSAVQQAIRSLCSSLAPGTWSSREGFEASLNAALAPRNAGAPRGEQLKLAAPLRRSIINALGERDPDAEICRDAEGNTEPDSELRDTEVVPLIEDPQTYLAREVLPYAADAWINDAVRDSKDGQIGKVGYEINLNREFYRYQPPRPLDDIHADLRQVEADITRMLGELTR